MVSGRIGEVILASVVGWSMDGVGVTSDCMVTVDGPGGMIVPELCRTFVV